MLKSYSDYVAKCIVFFSLCFAKTRVVGKLGPASADATLVATHVNFDKHLISWATFWSLF